MEDYIASYDNFNKTIIYNFCLGYGGIADLIKFFTFLLQYGIKNNIKIKYLVNNLLIEKFLKLKYQKMYINQDDIKDKETLNLSKLPDNDEIKENIYYIIIPQAVPLNSYDEIEIKISDIFNFSNEVINNAANIIDINIEYISIHLRLGDHFLETNPENIWYGNRGDIRYYDENQLFDFIERNNDKKILLFCDNRSRSKSIKDKYNFIIIPDYEIGHTSYDYATELQVLNTTTDFYLLLNSKIIYNANPNAYKPSGFSVIASKFYKIPFLNI